MKTESHGEIFTLQSGTNNKNVIKTTFFDFAVDIFYVFFIFS